MLLSDSCLTAFAGGTRSFQPKFDKHTFLLSVLLWAICQCGMVPSLDGKMLKSDHQRRFKDNAAIRETWWGGGFLKTQASQGWGSWALTCRNKKLILARRIWPPQQARSPDQEPLGQKRSPESVTEQCFSNMWMLTHFWEPCSNEDSSFWVQGGACDSAFLLSSQLMPFPEIASY